jgi:DNA-binding SARP family transcriptional activator
MQPVKDGLSVEMILSLLWPLHTPRAGYTAFLEQTRRLREKLGNISELFDFSNHLYTLSSSIILQYDVAEYEAQFSIASDIIYDDVQVWTAAQRLYTGTFLSDWPTATLPRPFVEWMERRRQHLETHYQAIGYRINTFLK